MSNHFRINKLLSLTIIFTLSDNKFPWRVESRDKIGIDIIRALLVIGGLEFDPRVVIR